LDNKQLLTAKGGANGADVGWVVLDFDVVEVVVVLIEVVVVVIDGEVELV